MKQQLVHKKIEKQTSEKRHEGALGRSNKKRMSEQNKKIKTYARDPFQFERMIGDYYYERKNFSSAFDFYDSFYQDMDKPEDLFTPQSMRNYIDILLHKNKLNHALHYMGYIINLKPYMIEDIVQLSELYSKKGDSISALLSLLFTYTLTKDYNTEVVKESRDRIDKLYNEVKQLPNTENIRKLIDIYLKEKELSKIVYFIDGLKKD